MAKHVMLDLETYGTKPGSIILSIGAVTFDMNGLYEEFYEVIDLKASKAWGFTEDFNTVKWWSKQSQAARKAVFEAETTVLPNSATHSFAAWVKQVGGISIWGNGADFDLPLLQAYFDKTGTLWPVAFYNHRCFRTLKTMCPPQEIAKNEEAHNALADAKWQAEYTIACLQWLKKVRGE
jgi:hypothetical protein